VHALVRLDLQIGVVRRIELLRRDPVEPAVNAKATRLLVVGTYRSDELYPRVPMRQWRTRLLTQRHAEEVRLPRLTPAQTAAMAAAITGSGLAGPAAEALHARS